MPDISPTAAPAPAPARAATPVARFLVEVTVYDQMVSTEIPPRQRPDGPPQLEEAQRAVEMAAEDLTGSRWAYGDYMSASVTRVE